MPRAPSRVAAEAAEAVAAAESGGISKVTAQWPHSVFFPLPTQPQRAATTAEKCQERPRAQRVEAAEAAEAVAAAESGDISKVTAQRPHSVCFQLLKQPQPLRLSARR